MKHQTMMTELNPILTDIDGLRNREFNTEDLRALFTHFVEQEAERGIVSYLFDVLPHVNNMFDSGAAVKEAVAGTRTAEISTFRDMINWIVSLVAPVCIYRLDDGYSMVNNQADLIIVVSKNSNKRFREYCAIINTVVFMGKKINYSLYQMQHLHKYVKEGSIFHIKACQQEHLVYHDGSEPLPPIASVNFSEIEIKAKACFEKGYNRGLPFLEGAKQLIEEGRADIASFMLHQAAELTLHGTILAISGIDVRNHSVMSLLQHCNRFAPQLCQIFPGGTVKEDNLINLLESAYLKSRYSNSFDVDAEEVALLMERVIFLLDTTEKLVSKTIGEFIQSSVRK
jgi:HEPN domain-containing protein